MTTPTIAELQKTIELFQKAHELHMKDASLRGPLPEGEVAPPNPLFDSLYLAAGNAAAALAPLMKVELVTKPIP